MHSIEGLDLNQAFLDALLYECEIMELDKDGFTDIRMVKLANGSRFIVQTKPNANGGYCITRIDYARF